MTPLGRAFALAGLLALTATPAAAAPRVVASILPVHSLLARVMTGIGTPALLLPADRSPHLASLRPSQARALARADAVFWIGPGLETFLAGPLARLARNARVVALAEAPGVRTRPGGAGTPEDFHLWLDPRNAAAMGRAMAATLAAIDPANAPRYAANGRRLEAALAALETEIAARLAPLRDRPFVVYHDAYRHFAARFGLHPLAAITPVPGRPPGARHLARVRALIAAAGPTCLFHEPGASPAILETIAGAGPIHRGVLDPLGVGIAPGPEAYATLMRRIAGALADCLETLPPR